MAGVLGIDIGGANLKAAHSSGTARLEPFELWKNPSLLPDALGRLLHGWSPFDTLAVTMTGELCDCFASKREGVQTILDAVERRAGALRVVVWQTDERLMAIERARAHPQLVAAGNWLALAVHAARSVPEGPGLLIDVGSTTTDIIPLEDGKPIPLGRTDPERLRSCELLYCGVRRTPLCALLALEAAAEVFATTLDAYLVLGKIREEPADRGTADGRPATRQAAHARLAKMLCADLETSTWEERLLLAQTAQARQLEALRGAVERVSACLRKPPMAAVLAGSGEFLARQLLRTGPLQNARVVSLQETLGPEVSACACAYALARLALERQENAR